MPHRFGQIEVWDRPVRVFHWGLASGVSAALVSGWLGFGLVHRVAGYAVTIVLALRIAWGFLGSHYARFASFHLSPAKALGYLRDMFHGRAERYAGHNPAASVMVMGLIALAGLIVASGLLTDGMINLEGPFGFLFPYVDDAMALATKHLHAALPFGIATLVVLHVSGVLASSRQHGENLVAAMVSGMKPAVTPSHRELPRDAVAHHTRLPAAGDAEGGVALAGFSDTRGEIARIRAHEVPVSVKRGYSDT